MAWATADKTTDIVATEVLQALDRVGDPIVIQLVKQVNFGPIESKRYFISTKGELDEPFVEIDEMFMGQNNFQKLNA